MGFQAQELEGGHRWITLSTPGSGRSCSSLLSSCPASLTGHRERACDMKRGWEKSNVLKCDQRENSRCPGLPRHTAK